MMRRLTMAQALVRYLSAQHIEIDGETLPLFAGIWAIFGHGNVAGMGEALFSGRNTFPVYRAHNEQAMAHAAIAFAKANRRRRMMACTTSIGPGATNMVTAAALAHVNRLPVLLLPGDVFANRRPDPVLQQIEDFSDPTITANDCFRPVSRYWDRITRPEQILQSLPAAISTLLDPVMCGPVTLALCQDVQAEAFDYPEYFFTPRVHRIRALPPDPYDLAAAIDVLKNAKRPLIIAGGGVHYASAFAELQAFAEARGIPVAETQAGKGAIPCTHPMSVGAIGVTGSAAANSLAQEADVVLAVGTRLQDFTTGSRRLFPRDQKLIQLNVAAADAIKHEAQALVADAAVALRELAVAPALSTWRSDVTWTRQIATERESWNAAIRLVTKDTGAPLPSDAEVLGVLNKATGKDAIVVCAAGGLPGELHKLWQCASIGSYHVEYGYSCMGYEIAGGLGVKLAEPTRDVFVLVGDGSYLMMNSEIATSIALDLKLHIVVLDNRGFGCINRLQKGVGSSPYGNLLEKSAPFVDFVQHAESLGARSEKADSLVGLAAAIERAKTATHTSVIVIDTDPERSTGEGGAWWDVAVPEVSDRPEVRTARKTYVSSLHDNRAKP